MPTIRTTFQPWLDVVVTDAERLYLLRQGLIYTGAPVSPPMTFSDGQYAELANADSEAIERIAAALGGWEPGEGGGGGSSVTVGTVAPSSGFWFDTASTIPNVNPTVTITSLAATLLVATLAFSGADSDGDTPLTYSVAWGDGTTSAGATSPLNHTYAATGSYTVTVTVTDTRGGTGVDSEGISVSSVAAGNYRAEILADSPAVYLRLGETTGTNANDETANNRDGTYSGAFALNGPSLVGTGTPTGRSVVLTGSGTGKIVVPYNVAWMPMVSLTAECRIKMPASVASVIIMGRWGSRSWLLSVSSGYLSINIRTGGADVTKTAVTGVMLPNTNYTLAMTYSDTTKVLSGYVNGAKVINETLTGTWDTAAGSEPFTIGGAAAGVWSDMTIAEVSLTDGILSDARIAARHAAAL